MSDDGGNEAVEALQRVRGEVQRLNDEWPKPTGYGITSAYNEVRIVIDREIASLRTGAAS